MGRCGRIWNVTGTKFSAASLKDKWGVVKTYLENGTSRVTVGWEVKIPPVLQHQQVPLADIWWVCGESKLRRTLREDWSGLCTRVMLISDVQMLKPGDDPNDESEEKQHRVKRSYTKDPSVYIDAIGQPRGIPNEFKARNEILAGLEAMIPTIGVTKNLEWLNYIFYNQQRFINYTDDALKALGEQLSATSLMTLQNRQALDWLLAKEGGVCIMFGEQCCTYIPNNTTPGGSFYLAMEKISNLRKETHANAGFQLFLTDWFTTFFGAWGGWAMKMLINLGIVLVVIALIFCCVFPCLREMCLKATVKQMSVTVRQVQDDDSASVPLLEIQTTETESFGPLPEEGSGGEWGKGNDKW